MAVDLSQVLRNRSGDPCAPDSEGIVDALGPDRPRRTLAQLSNVVPPTPQLYERVWRVRSSGLLSGGSLTLDAELAALRLAMPTEGVLADIGCSEGLYARTVAEAGPTVLAIDHSRPFLRRTVLRAGPLPVVALRALAQHLPIVDASLGGVMIGGSLNEIGDIEAAVAEMARVTKVGGRLFSMSLVHATSTVGRVSQGVLRAAGIVFPTRARTIDIYERAGFRINRCDQDGIVVRVTGTRITS